MSFWCLQFLPKNKWKQVNLRYHRSKVKFICSCFGRIHAVTICFQVLLTFDTLRECILFYPFWCTNCQFPYDCLMIVWECLNTADKRCQSEIRIWKHFGINGRQQQQQRHQNPQNYRLMRLLTTRSHSLA